MKIGLLPLCGLALLVAMPGRAVAQKLFEIHVLSLQLATTKTRRSRRTRHH